jgi:hypothetical protein
VVTVNVKETFVVFTESEARRVKANAPAAVTVPERVSFLVPLKERPVGRVPLKSEYESWFPSASEQTVSRLMFTTSPVLYERFPRDHTGGFTFAAWVVTRAGPATAELFPAASNAVIVYEYWVEGVKPVSV